MRLWSIHPSYLDPKGLVALWRESLLAQAVLADRTKGYRHHPQLSRFRSHPEPAAAIRGYLTEILAEADRRGYGFDPSRIDSGGSHLESTDAAIEVTAGQLEYELRLLKSKLSARDPAAFATIAALRAPRPHPMFRRVPGGIEHWERPKPLE